MVFQENFALPCLEDDIAITHLTYGKDLKWDGNHGRFFLVVRFPVFFWGVESVGMEAFMMGSLLMNHLEVQSPTLLNMKFFIFGGCDWEGETWQLSYQATLKTVFFSRFWNPKLWNGQSFGDAMEPLYWLTTWNHTNQLGPAQILVHSGKRIITILLRDLFFTFMDSTLTMFRQYPNHQCEIQLSVSMFPHFVLNLL